MCLILVVFFFFLADCYNYITTYWTGNVLNQKCINVVLEQQWKKENIENVKVNLDN